MYIIHRYQVVKEKELQISSNYFNRLGHYLMNVHRLTFKHNDSNIRLFMLQIRIF